MGKYDDRSFGEAFAAFRRERGAGETFPWRGKTYSTNYKEEAASGSSNSSRSSSSRRPSTEELTSRARSAIDRAESKPFTRPRARPDREAPVATSVETPEVTTSRLPPSQRPRPRPERPVSRTPGSLRGITLEDWAGMTPAERRNMGLPNNRGAAREMLESSTGSTSTRLRGVTIEDWSRMSPAERRRLGLPNNRGEARRMLERANMAKGGMVKKGYSKGGMAKKGYAKGGMIRANCGASMKPTQKGTKK